MIIHHPLWVKCFAEGTGIAPRGELAGPRATTVRHGSRAPSDSIALPALAG